MKNQLNRRAFVTWSAASSMAIHVTGVRSESAPEKRPVRVGIIGIGGRGCSLLQLLVKMERVFIKALCDIDPKRFDYANQLCQRAGHPIPDRYDQDEYAYEKLVRRDDIDLVIIATPWNWHATMAVAAMKAGKYVGVEVPAAVTIDECWDLVNTSEATGIPCMMLENWSFRRDNLAVLNMIREGMFGETVHSQCSYSHDCVTYFFDREGNPRWQGEFVIKHNRDIYPTHGLGPVLSWLDIHCGDRFDTLVSVATESFGIERNFEKQFGQKPPAVKQGDIVSTIIKTKKGKTIYISNDMLLPRPYDNRWILQGTRGIYSFERESIYLDGISPQSHTWEPFLPYQERFEHRWWKNAPANIEELGHGGPDYLELAELIAATRAKNQTPLDVYDSAAMSSVVALSEQSIAANHSPVQCPDFTRGRWKTAPARFAL